MNSDTPQTPFSGNSWWKGAWNGVRRFWDKLTGPSRHVTEVGRRHQASLTASLALVLFLLCFIGYFAISAANGNPLDAGALTVGGLAVATLITYFLARTRHYQIGAFIGIATTFLMGYGLVIFGDSEPVPAFFSTAPIAFILSTGLLSIPAQLVLLVVNFAFALLLPMIAPQVAGDIGMIVGQINAMGLLAIVITATRNAIERARLKEIQRANEQLNELSAGLEKRVSERTRDVALAAEVGRRLSRAQDTGNLLADAAELIRERFDLYYVQIYLVDAESKNLVLRAGTGEAGRELLERAHRLPLDLTSINGTAAVEHHAVIVSDTSKNRMFRPNRLLPETHAEMAVPLISGEQVLGVLNLQSKIAGSLSEENLAAYEVLAGQLAATLYNASLLAKTENALKELEARSQGAIRAGWEDYLDAIEQRERIAYMAEAGAVEPAEEIPTPAADDRTLLTPIKVSGETIGTFQFATEQSWGNQDRILVETVAGQVAQQLENLRLLSQAERYQKQTEATLQRMTSANWEEYLKSIERGKTGFTYDQEMVQLSDPEATPEGEALTYDLKVQDTPIGMLQITGKDWLSSEDNALLKAVSDQLSAHLENMRLFNTAQRELQDRRVTETRLSEAQRSAKIANWSLDVATNTFIFNDEFYRLAGTSIEQEGSYEMPAMVYAQRFVHPEDSYIVGEKIGEALVTTDPNYLYEGTSRMIRGNGEIIYVTVRTRVQMDEEGRVVRLNGANQDVTEQVLQQQMLTTERQRLAEAQKAAKLASWSLDVATTTFTFNDEFYRLAGTSIEQEGTYEMPAHIYAQRFVHPEDVQILAALASDDPNYEYEGTSRMIRSDGEIIYVTVRTRAETNAEGKIVRVNGSNQDVTEQFTQQQLLATERQRLTEAQQAAKMANWSFDVATGTFIFNDEFYRLAGTSIEQEGSYEMPAQIYAERFVHPEDAHIVGDKIGEALVTTDPNYLYEGTSRMIRATGEIIYVTVRTRIQMDEHGKVIRLNGSNQDVTEQVLQQQLLASERQRLAEALDVAKMAYWAYDFDSGTFQLNDDVYRMYATTAEEQGGYEMSASTMLLNFIHPADRQHVMSALQESARNPEAGGQREMTYRIIKGTGENATILSRYRIETNPDGSIRVAGTNQDVTEQVRQQQLTAQRAAELATVAEISTTISSMFDPDRMLQEVVDLTKQRFDFYHAHIYLLDEDGQNLVLRAGAGGIGRQMVAEGRSIPLDSEKSLVARTARERKGEIVNDTHADPNFLPHPLLPNTASEVSVPLVAGDQLLGVLDAQDDQVDRFTDENINVLTTLASQVAVSLQNSRSYIRAQQQAERESMINAISERIQSTTSVEAALQVAVRELGRALGAQRTVIQLGLQQQDGQDN